MKNEAGELDKNSQVRTKLSKKAKFKTLQLAYTGADMT